MNLSPTSRTLFLIQIGTFFIGVIVIACNCLYVSAYPKSPNAGSLSGIAIGTLAFALFSTLTTLVLILRQKSGRTISAALEGGWVGLALVLWILAAIGGIAKPANGMTHVSCRVLPDGKDTDDKNFIRACQSIFASTAFCIVSALFFMATASLLITFSIQRTARDRKAAKVKVGGTYALGPSPSQYRRAEQNGEVPTETPKDEESTGANAPERDNLLSESATTGGFSENVYRTPVLTQATTPAPVPAPAHTPVTVGPAVQMPYNTYSSGHGHAQPSYHSQAGSYDYSMGHVQQGSAVSSPGVYDQFNAGYPPMQSYPPQMQMMQPMQQMPMQQMQQMPMEQMPMQIPFGTQQYSNAPLPHQTTPIMTMPRPEHF